MPNMIGVRFTSAGKVGYFDAGDLDLKVGDRVIVDAEEGPREASVVISAEQVVYSDLRGPMLTVIERISSEDGPGP